jgi:hypothetical protein
LLDSEADESYREQDENEEACDSQGDVKGASLAVAGSVTELLPIADAHGEPPDP